MSNVYDTKFNKNTLTMLLSPFFYFFVVAGKQNFRHAVFLAFVFKYFRPGVMRIFKLTCFYFFFDHFSEKRFVLKRVPIYDIWNKTRDRRHDRHCRRVTA